IHGFHRPEDAAEEYLGHEDQGHELHRLKLVASKGREEDAQVDGADGEESHYQEDDEDQEEGEKAEEDRGEVVQGRELGPAVEVGGIDGDGARLSAHEAGQGGGGGPPQTGQNGPRRLWVGAL